MLFPETFKTYQTDFLQRISRQFFFRSENVKRVYNFKVGALLERCTVAP